MQFRYHRGGLAESIATLVHLDPTFDALCEHLNQRDIVIKPYCNGDPRIGWKACYIVSDSGGVIGFVDEMPIEPPKCAK